MQYWITGAAARAVGDRAHEFVYATNGPEVLYELAENGPFDLAITQAALPHIAGAQVLAMVRTAGLATPFVVLDYVPSDALRHLVDRVGGARLVDDPLDSGAVYEAARSLLGTVDRWSPERLVAREVAET